MADPWNLSLDQSCFEDWHEEKISIRGEDLSDLYRRISKLQNASSNDCQDLVKILNQQLSLFLDISVCEQDIHSAVRILHVVSTKLNQFPESTILLLAQSSKKLFFIILEINCKGTGLQEDLKQLFEILNSILANIKTSCNVSPMINILEIIDHSYKIAFEKLPSSENVFKGASNLLLLSLPLLEQESNQFGPGIGEILKVLVNIGKYSCKLDAKSMASVWKFILRTLQQQPALCSELHLGNAVIFLVDEIVSTHFDVIAKTLELEQRHAKIIGFLLKVIVGLVERDSILESDAANEAVLRLVIQLQRFTPDAAKFELRFSDQAIRLLETNVTLTIHPFVENLLKTKQFKCSLESAAAKYPQDIRYLLRVLGLIMTPCYSSNLPAHFTTKELLNIFLSTAEKAHAELNGPLQVYGVRHSGQGLYTVPLYELLVTQSCSCLAVLSADAISDCIAVLLFSAMRRGYWAYLLANDILAYLSRYGSAQFCLELVQYIFSLNSTALNYRSTHLLNRLIPLLSNNGRTTLLKSHPVEAYPDVWAAINWSSFTPDQQAVLSRSLIPPTASSPTPPASVILRLNSLSRSQNKAAIKERNDLLPGLVRAATQLITWLPSKQAQDYYKHVEYLIVCSIRAMLTIVQPEVKEQHLLLMQILKVVLDAKILVSVLLEACNFLLNIGPVGFATSPQQPAILRVVANLFSECLASNSTIVRFHALNTFEVFFKVTPHASLAPSCIKEGQDQLVKQYIGRIRTKSDPEDLVPFWKAQAEVFTFPPLLFRKFPNLPSDSSTVPPSEAIGYSEVISNGTIAKRPRIESDEQLQFLLSSLSKIVTDIGTLCPIPSWSKEEIRERITILNSYL